MIIGKSSIEKDKFDVLIFCARNAEKVRIPNFIKTIGSYSFNKCYQLRSGEIQKKFKT